MKKYRVELTELAVQDIQNTGDYITFELKNPMAARKWIRGIRERIKTLANNPQRHELIEDELLKLKGVRKIYYQQYRIFYIVDEVQRCVQITRVLHMLTESNKWLYSSLVKD